MMTKMRLGYCAVAVALLVSCSKQEPTAFYPVVRAAMPGGYSLTAVQPSTNKGTCVKTNDRFSAPLKANCPECKIEFSGCEATLSGSEKAMMTGEPLAQYSIAAGSIRILLVGADSVTRPVCEKMAADLAGKSPGKASCVAPVKPK